jgi:hypothetical protein
MTTITVWHSRNDIDYGDGSVFSAARLAELTAEALRTAYPDAAVRVQGVWGNDASGTAVGVDAYVDGQQDERLSDEATAYVPDVCDPGMMDDEGWLALPAED